MILRIVLGRLPSGTDADALVELRGRLARAARDVSGLDSLIVGARTALLSLAEGDLAVEAGDHHRLARRGLDGPGDRVSTSRIAFSGIGCGCRSRSIEPCTTRSSDGRSRHCRRRRSAYVRIVTVRARPNEEARLLETLRDRHPRLVELGMVASHLGRRVVAGECEAVTVGVWPDRATIRAATGGGPERPLFEQELSHWADTLRLETYDGIEIAPRLPAASGPPIFVMDDDLRIVDTTAAAAAAVGWEPVELVGRTLSELTRTEPAVFARNVENLRREGVAAGEAKWHIPEAGEVFLRYRRPQG